LYWNASKDGTMPANCTNLCRNSLLRAAANRAVCPYEFGARLLSTTSHSTIYQGIDTHFPITLVDSTNARDKRDSSVPRTADQHPAQGVVVRQPINDVLYRRWQAYFGHICNEMLRAPPRQGKPEQTVGHQYKVSDACQLIF
jgi:hypothetical protein